MPQKHLTLRQAKALKLVNEGVPVSRAMRQSGYSIATAHQPDKFMKNTIIQSTIADMPLELVGVGLTKKYVAAKLKEQFDATKIHTSHTEPDREVPDNIARLKAIDKWHEFMKEGHENDKVKRRMTITEFVNEGIEKTTNENNSTD